MFKGKIKARNIIDTSKNNVVRIEKRERLMSVLYFSDWDLSKKYTDLITITNYHIDVEEFLKDVDWVNVDKIGRYKYVLSKNKTHGLKHAIHKIQDISHKKKSLRKTIQYIYTTVFTYCLFNSRYYRNINDEYALFKLDDFTDDSGAILKHWFKTLFNINIRADKNCIEIDKEDYSIERFTTGGTLNGKKERDQSNSD